MGDRNLVKPLHGLRGLAALVVVTHHLSPLKFSGAIGVILFFVLSGFLMGRLYLVREFDAVQVWRYVTARLARIYPLFALVILSAAILNRFFGFEIFWMESWEVDRHLVMLGDAHTVWTVAVECHFYAIFLVIWFAFARGKLNFAKLVLLYVALACAAYFFDGRINPLRYLHIFVLGMIVARIADAPPPVLQRWAGCALPLAALVAVAAAVYGADSYANTLLVLVAGVIVLCSVTAPNSPFARLISLPPFVWLGEISFGAYLLHRFVEQFVARLLGSTDKTWFSFAISIGLTLLLATLVFRFYEDPMRRLIRKLSQQVEQGWSRRKLAA